MRPFRVLSGVVVASVGALLALRLTGMLDRNLLYFPEPLERLNWRKVSGLPIEDARILTPDGVALHAWWIPAERTGPVLIWCHGNAGNISHRREHLAPLVRSGISVLIFDYRGFGDSRGTPSEQGLYADAEAAYQHLIQGRGVAPGRIVIFGKSLGAAVAADLAARHPDAAAVVLEAPFPSIEAAARLLYGGLPVHALISARFDTAERLKRIRLPVLVMHGDRDTVLPLELGQAVFAAANAPKEWFLIRGSGHNDIFVTGGEVYYRTLIGFIRRNAGQASGSDQPDP